jgi:hypothetical protein
VGARPLSVGHPSIDGYRSRPSILPCFAILDPARTAMSSRAPSASPAHERNVVIIGGGAIGVCTAYYLLHSPHPPGSVTLIEAHALASGSSGTAGGFLALDWHGPTTTSLARLSWHLHADLAKEHNGAGAWGYRVVDSVSYDVRVSSAASTPGSNSTPRLSRRESYLDEPPTPTPTPLEGGVDQSWLNKDGDVNLLGTIDSTAQVCVLLAVKDVLIYLDALATGSRTTSSRVSSRSPTIKACAISTVVRQA